MNKINITATQRPIRTKPRKEMMEKKPMQSPSFFKILTVDFTRKIRIPSAFSRKYRQILREGDVTLRSSSGQTWQVKLEITKDKNYEFTRGWSGFAEDAGLKFGEFLVFWVVGISMFDVAVYAVTCCQREIPADNSTGIHYSPDVGNDGASGSHQSLELPKTKSPLYFETTLKEYQCQRFLLSIPKKFRDSAGLVHKGSVRLLYLPTNRSLSVVTNCRSGNRTEFGSGWSEFMKANKLVSGRRYSFEFKPRKGVILVKELKTAHPMKC